MSAPEVRPIPREAPESPCSARFPWALDPCPNLAEFERDGAAVCAECLDELRELERERGSEIDGF